MILAAKIVSVWLLSSTSGQLAHATPDAKRVRVDQRVTLFAVARDERGVLWSDASIAPGTRVDLRDGKGRRAVKPWSGEPLRVEWLKIEPTAEWLDNENGGFHWETIPYVETKIAASTLAIEADVAPTVLPARRDGERALGTMHFQVKVEGVSTPGAETRFRGGLATNVHRVSVRRDDTFLGFLTELFNTPYIWASAGDDPVHQAERGIGADCADFIAYGLRRTGKPIRYGSTYDVPAWGGKKTIASVAARDGSGRFVDANGNAIVVGERGVRRGDLLLFHRHVGAFVEDREPKGVLDANDVLIHTAWAPPAEESFESSARWTSPPFAIYRVR